MCVPAGEVAYVDAAASDANTDCTEELPCRTIGRGIDRLRAYVVVRDGAYVEDLAIASRTVTIIGHGVSLAAQTNDTPAVEVTGLSTVVRLHGLALVDSEIGVDCLGTSVSTAPVVELQDVTIRNMAAEGISSDLCSLTVERSRIVACDGGGIDIDGGRFVAVNSIVAGNGVIGSWGGMRIRDPESGSRILFSTIADNASSTTGDYPPGIVCESAVPVDLHSNMITGNTGGSSGDQVSTNVNCPVEHSLVNPAFAGNENVTGDPDFIDADFHLGPDSAALDQARPDTGVVEDVDRDLRPADLPDIGADERVP